MKPFLTLDVKTKEPRWINYTNEDGFVVTWDLITGYKQTIKTSQDFPDSEDKYTLKEMYEDDLRDGYPVILDDKMVHKYMMIAELQR